MPQLKPIIAIAVLVTAPLLLGLVLFAVPYHLFSGNTDGLFYQLMMVENGSQFLQGDLWPRWLINANSGVGYPVMYYYPPLVYLLSGVLTAPLADLSPDVRMLAAMYMATVASGVTAYLWLRTHFAAQHAWVGALLYMLLPYKIIMIYLHLNLAQLWALVWLPLWMLASEMLIKRPSRGVALFALCGALVGYSHPPTLLAFCFIPFAYVGWLVLRAGNAPSLPLGSRRPALLGASSLFRFVRELIPLALAVFLLGALYAPYVMQLKLANSWLTGNEFAEGTFNALNNLSHVDTAFTLGYLIAAALGLMLLERLRVQNVLPASARNAVFFSTVMIGLWIITLRISAPLWEWITPLQLLQFPVARLSAGMQLATCFIIVFFISTRHALASRPAFLQFPVLAGLLVINLIAVVHHVQATYSEGGEITETYLQEMREARVIPYLSPHYQLKWNHVEPYNMHTARLEMQKIPQAEISQGTGAVTIEEWEPGFLRLQANVSSDQAVLVVKQSYVPSWVAHDDVGGSIAIEPYGAHGLMALTLPKGKHKLTVLLAHSEEQRIALVACAAALAACVGLLALSRNRKLHV